MTGSRILAGNTQDEPWAASYSNNKKMFYKIKRIGACQGDTGASLKVPSIAN